MKTRARIAIGTFPTQADPLIVVMQLEELTAKVDQVLEILKRIEATQIKTTAPSHG